MIHLPKRMLHLMAAGVAIASLSGCAMMGYDSEFSCPKASEGSPCMSATEAYEASESGLPPQPAPATDTHAASRADRAPGDPRNNFGHHAGDTAAHPAPRASAAPAAPAVSPAPNLPALRALDSPRPIRTPAQVMRIYVAPWVDESGDLTMPTYVFTEIEPRRWTIGEPIADTAAPHFYPLQVHDREDPKGTSQTPGHSGAASAAHTMSINR